MFMQVMGEALGTSGRLITCSAFSGIQSTCAYNLICSSKQCCDILGMLSHFIDGGSKAPGGGVLVQGQTASR